jgi:aminodeoxyfutalosine synthase
MKYSSLDLLKKGNVSAALLSIAEKVLAEERISAQECEVLYEKASLGYLGMLANEIKEQRHGNVVFFNRNFHIEPTNICVFDCKFCSYSRLLKHREEGWEYSEEQILDIVRSYQNKPVTEVHIVGGVHPKMGLQYFAELIRKIKEIMPNIHVKAFTAVELEYMCRKAGLSFEEGLKVLKEHGQDSLPGGGAEIFDEVIREQICADKCTAQQWLEIHRTAHRIGMPSNATMLYGHIESYSHRIDHMERLRKLQDETGGFNTFIPLKFRNKGNQMSHIAEVSVIEDLRNYAVARLYLDNFAHIKAYWPMIGRSTAQLSLSYGVNDLDGTIDDTTKIYSMAGSEEHSPSLSTEELIALISETGRVAVERDTVYNVIRNYSEQPLEAETTSNT